MIPRKAFVVFLLGALVASMTGCFDTPNDPATSESSSTSIDPALFERWIEQHRAKHEAMTLYTGPQGTGRGGGGEAEPIPGGLGGGTFHVWLPGPIDLGAQGLDVEPSTITDFKGFAAAAYLAGTVTASDGVTYDMFHDMRIFQGKYTAADGSSHRGSFAFI